MSPSTVAANVAYCKLTAKGHHVIVLLLQFGLSGPPYPVFKVRRHYWLAGPRPALAALVQGQRSHLVPA